MEAPPPLNGWLHDTIISTPLTSLSPAPGSHKAASLSNTFPSLTASSFETKSEALAFSEGRRRPYG